MARVGVLGIWVCSKRKQARGQVEGLKTIRWRRREMRPFASGALARDGSTRRSTSLPTILSS
jgi:hypothetical protein